MGFALLNPSYDSPLSPAELAESLAAIGGFEARPEIAVAVSGGPDSMALMLLVDRWARQQGGRAWGLTVDHGLRHESARECRTVAGWLAARDVPHEILTWQGEKPASGIQEAARAARYRLLAAWCREHGVLHLFAAHHREDQAETHLIRRRAGSGADGLAAMSAIRELPGCRLVRPLLSMPRARLAALLDAEGQPFLCDPSNRNPIFERARLRLALGGNPPSQAGAGRVGVAARGARHLDSIIAETCELGRLRIARERVLDRLIGRAVALHPAGFAALDRAMLHTAEDELAERLLGRVAACIGGAPYPARRARLARLRAGLAAAPRQARTLGGCCFVPWRGHVLVLRELAAAAPALRHDPADDREWDRRFAVVPAAGATGGFTLDYLGRHPGAGRGIGDGGLPRLVRSVLPAWWDERGLAAVPHLGYCRPGGGALPALAFRPAHALAQAGFTVV